MREVDGPGRPEEGGRERRVLGRRRRLERARGVRAGQGKAPRPVIGIRGESVTDPGHRPKSHADFLDHDSGWYRLQAREVGPSTQAVVESFLAAGTAEEQGWRWCEKLLAKRESVGIGTLEDVCAAALSVTDSPSYTARRTLIRNRRRRIGPDDGGNGEDYAIRRFK